MSNEVIIKDAVKRYGDFTALNGVSLDIREGEFFTLLGPSGCGKTTLLNAIGGLDKIHSGEIWLDDDKIRKICGLDMPVRLVITLGYASEAESQRVKKRKSLAELVTKI